MRLPVALLMVVTLGGTVSCSNKVTTRVVLPDEDIRLEMAASGGGSPGAPVTLRGRIVNAGAAAVVPFYQCGVPVVRIYDAAQTELFQFDPTQPVPCPLGLVAPLQPGQSVEFSLTFDGDYFTEGGVPSTAPPGTYRAVATFRYTPPNPTSPSDIHGLTREQSFTWQ